jgi:hypothetical protein
MRSVVQQLIAYLAGVDPFTQLNIRRPIDLLHSRCVELQDAAACAGFLRSTQSKVQPCHLLQSSLMAAGDRMYNQGGGDQLVQSR